MKSGILFSVGAGGRNVDIDVETIQRMLNRVPMMIGPPSPLLREDGDCGPLTIAAIRRFQQRAQLAVQDGKIDPGKTTHQRLAFVTDQVKELPERMELGLKMAPHVLTMVNSARTILNNMVSELNNFRPPLRTPDANRARVALLNHFSLTTSQQDDPAVIGRIAHHLNGIGVLISNRPIKWTEATMKQSKIDSNRPKQDWVPSIFQQPRTRNILFTPNYKQFDLSDRMGWGPLSLAYELIKGVGYVELDLDGDEFFLESSDLGYPGSTFQQIVEFNPATYAGFVMEMRLHRFQHFGRNFRQL
jgi:hypothetical protein